MAPLKAANVTIKAVGGEVAGHSRRAAALILQWPQCQVPVEFTALCLSHLGIWTPAIALNHYDTAPWSSHTLADPHYHQPGPIDLLLGSDTGPHLVKPGFLKQGDLVAQNTVVGWMI